MSARGFFTAILVSALPLVTHGAGKQSFFHQLASDSYIRNMFATTTQPVRSVRQIPSYIIKAARQITGDDFRMADPKERYISGCGMILPDDNGLPFRQMRFATKSDSHFIICYHRGGAAQAVCILAFVLDPPKKSAEPVLVAQISMSEPYETLANIRRAFAAGKLDQYRPTYIDF